MRDTFQIEKIASKPEVEKIAITLCDIIQEQNIKILLLRGGLGAGKTYLSGKIINYLAKVDSAIKITSPTFSIVNSYQIESFGTVNHFDLYRIKNELELQNIGMEELLLVRLNIIEWPDLSEGYWCNFTRLVVEINPTEEEEMRRFVITIEP